MSAPRAVPTVAVVHPEGEGHGFITINASDFDPAVHTEWDASRADEPTAAAKPSKRGSKP